MIDGITILNESPVYESLIPFWLPLLLMFIAVPLVISGISNLSEKWGNIIFVIGTILTVIVVMLFVLCLIPDKTNIDHVEYQVTIDDDIYFKEFDEKYEVIDKEGKIYTIIEREKNDEDIRNK